MVRPTVLVADDHRAILDRVSDYLSREFDIVAMVQDGQAAFDAAVALRPDAVVLDISMPHKSGLDVARQLAALPNPPAIVFLTMHDDADFVAAAADVGAAGYVLKCNMLTELSDVVWRALRP